MATKRTDWTKKPLGAARAKLNEEAKRLVLWLRNPNQPAHLVDSQCRAVERAIAAFRDNER